MKQDRIQVVLGVVVALLAGNTWAGAKLEVTPVTPPNSDFGRQVKNLGKYPFVYKFKNVGDQPLRFEVVRPGCGCLAIEGPKRVLEPGEESEMKGVFNGAGYEGFTEKGVYILTNDEKIRARGVSFKIFLPYVKDGLRFFPNTYRNMCAAKDGKMMAHPILENGNLSAAGRKFLEEQAVNDKNIVVPPPGETDITVTGVRMPEGWKCLTPFPLVVKAEPKSGEKAKLEFICENWDGKDFHEIPFYLLTDSKVRPELKGTLNYAKPKLPPLPKPGTPGVRVETIQVPGEKNAVAPAESAAAKPENKTASPAKESK